MNSPRELQINACADKGKRAEIIVFVNQICRFVTLTVIPKEKSSHSPEFFLYVMQTKAEKYTCDKHRREWSKEEQAYKLLISGKPKKKKKWNYGFWRRSMTLEYIVTAMRVPSSIQSSSASSMWPDWPALQYIALDLLVDCKEASRMTLQNSLKMLSALHQRVLPTALQN